MYSKRIYIEIILRLGVIILWGVLSVLGIVSGHAVILGCIGLVLVLFLTFRLVQRLNATNRRISLFFDAIENGESTLIFPEINLTREQVALNKTFNRISRLITETKCRSQQKEHFYKALLEQVPGGLIAWDESGKIRTVNNAALRLLGRPSLTYRYELALIDPDFPAILQEANEKGSSQMKVTDEWQKRQLVVSLNRVKLKEDTFTLLSLQDIDESLSRKESEAWGKLTHVLTHEIMNSIAPIVSLSGTLTSYFETGGVPKPAGELTDRIIEKTLRGLRTVKEQGCNLINFTDSYRKLSFLQVPSVKPYNLRKQLEQLKELVTPELEKAGITWHCYVAPAATYIKGDETLLGQVFHNLALNAIQALEKTPGATLHITANLVQELVIQVKDNGPGIPKEMQEDIFVPFFTTKENGSGIGLSLSRQIIRRHRGQLHVKSEPGAGTCFIIRLPQ